MHTVCPADSEYKEHEIVSGRYIVKYEHFFHCNEKHRKRLKSNLHFLIICMTSTENLCNFDIRNVHVKTFNLRGNLRGLFRVLGLGFFTSYYVKKHFEIVISRKQLYRKLF